MAKGPKFRNSNAQRHRERTDNPLWREQCAEVDVEKLRVQMSIEYVRAKGGLTYEEKQALRARVSDIQKAKHRREARLFRDIYAA
jgi:uncharacterized membrane protein